MIKPIPRGSPRGPWPESEKDYNIMAPLNGVDKTYPCQGKPKGQVMESWQAGNTSTPKIQEALWGHLFFLTFGSLSNLSFETSLNGRHSTTRMTIFTFNKV
jgi:hypothetical protein